MYGIVMSILIMYGGLVVTTHPLKGVPIVGRAQVAKADKWNKTGKSLPVTNNKKICSKKGTYGDLVRIKPVIDDMYTKGDTLKVFYWDTSSSAAYFYWNQPDSYDDSLYSVKFTPSQSGQLVGVAFWFYHLVGSGNIRIHVWNDNGGGPGTELGYMDISTSNIYTDGHGTYVDLSSLGINVGNGDFYIGYSLLSGVDTLGLIYDTSGIAPDRCYDMYNGSWEQTDSWWADYGGAGTHIDWLITAYIETSGGGSGYSANLKPYTPTGWYSSLVISADSSDTTAAPPGNYSTNPGDSQYVHWAVINEGPDDIPSTDTIYYYLYREGQAIAGWYSQGLQSGYYVYVKNYKIHESTDGSYTYQITADPDNTIPETNESDNSHSETYTWGTGGGGGGGSGSIGPADFVIITSSSFAPYFEPLADWKNQKGIRTRIVSLDTIYANYTGNDNAEKIRNFIKDMNANYGTMYFLLGGQCDYENGEEIVPRRNAFVFQSNAGYYTDEDTIITDLYFADLDGTWDGDGDGTYGETSDNVDMYPDVYVGRAPVKNTSQVQNFVNKLLYFERSPYQDASYIKSSFHPQGNLWDTNHGTSMPDTMVQFDPADWTHTFMREDVEGVSESSVNSEFNNGYQLVHFVGHGNEYGVYYNNGSSTMMNNTDADNLSNGFDKLSITTSIACFAGAMDEVSNGDCFAEHLVNATNGGTVASLFNSRYGWGYSSPEGALGPSGEQSKYFFRAIHQNGLYILGQVWANMQSSMVPDAQNDNYFRWCLYERNLLGDPTLEIWTEVPVNLVMTVNTDTILQGQDTVITVTVSDAKSKAAVSDAVVTLLQKFSGDSYDIYLVDTTDASGTVSFSVNAAETNDIVITSTKHNYIYAQDTVYVVPTTGVGEQERGRKIRFALRNNIISGYLSIAYEAPVNTKVDVVVYGVDGRLVKSEEFTVNSNIGVHSVNLSTVRPGVYFVNINARDYKKIEKILKTR